MSLPERLPSFDELPIKPDKPPRSAWGLFGDDDQVGMINLLTPERVVAAARLVRHGKVFALNWELELPNPPLFFREGIRQTIKQRRKNVHDDIYDNFNTQSSTQWDGLTHYGHRQHGFYNGATAAEVTGREGTRNGIEHWARRGIAGRGVLVDFARWAKTQGLAFNPGTRSEITVEQLQAAARAQGVSFQTGDILIMRTGWMEWYLSLSAQERFLLAHKWPFEAGGVRQGEEALRFLWDNHFAAIASDCTSFEAYPARDPDEGMMHETILGLWGMPIGEMFYLEALAADCAEDGVYEFFLTSAPLNKLGGVASPPNALAIK
jgi:kynurenine formamidase